ncbi:MAG: hypothetical protein ACRERC_25085 [Candidatus Binatia bacterium]
MDDQSLIQIAERIFEAIRGAFPHLRMELDRQHPHVELNMDIPRQPGLLFRVNLNLQGDELHLSADAFWLEWFPCTKPEIADEFQRAVEGLLAGEFRIVEHYRGSRFVRGELQAPDGDGWRTVGSGCSLRLPWGTRSTRVLQNVGSDGAPNNAVQPTRACGPRG